MAKVWGQSYSDVATSIGINHVHGAKMLMGGGTAFFDYDGDGDDDLYLTGGSARDHLYRNNGDGTFTEVGLNVGLGITEGFYSFGVITGDIENDGDRDVFLTTAMDYDTAQQTNTFWHCRLLINDGNGNFIDNSVAAGIVDSALSISASFGDFNKDGYLDIYVGNYTEYKTPITDSTGQIVGVDATGFSNFYYINNGNGTFTQSANLYGIDHLGCALATAATDYDSDGDVDLYVANDFGEWSRPNTLYQNINPSTHSFSDVSMSSNTNVGMFGMGIAIGDYDEDLDLDYYVTNLGRNVLLNNNGNGVFADSTDFASVQSDSAENGKLATGWGCAFLDYDNDSYLDLIVANGYIPMPSGFRETALADPNRLYRNNGDGTFTDMSTSVGVADSVISHGLAFSDFDKDGDLDVAVNVIDYVSTSSVSNPLSLFYRNDVADTANHWCAIKLIGTMSNRDAFGAQAYLYAGGRVFMREVDGGSSHASQNSSILHFGLAGISALDSVVIEWPNTGRERFIIRNINQYYTLTEGLSDNVRKIESINPFTAMPNPFRNTIVIDSEVEFVKTIEVFNLLGKQLFIAATDNKTYTIQLDNLSNGVYIIRINGKYQFKMIKQD